MDITVMSSPLWPPGGDSAHHQANYSQWGQNEQSFCSPSIAWKLNAINRIAPNTGTSGGSLRGSDRLLLLHCCLLNYPPFTLVAVT